MTMTLTLNGSHDLGSVVASVLGRLAVAEGLPDSDTSGLVAAVSGAVDRARGSRDASVSVAFAWATDHIDIEIGPPGAPAALRLSVRLPAVDGPAQTT